MITVHITVGLKRGVADPEGKNTKKALELLGFSGLMSVSTSKRFSIVLDTDDREAAKRSAGEMCEKLLANPVIQTYAISLE